MADNAGTVRAIEEAWDAGRLDELDQYFADDFDNTQSATPGVPPGLEGAKMAHQGVMHSFPNRKIEILDIVADGDDVVVRTRVTGSNEGGFPPFGVGANGNPFDIQSWSLYRFRDGKVVSHVGLNDAFMLGIQLGALRLPGG